MATTDRPAPVRWRASARATIAGTAAVAVATGALLSAQVATGRDPALAAIAARAAQARTQAAVVAPSPRRVVVRRVIVRRVVTHPAPVAAAPATAPPPTVRTSAPAPVAAVVAAPPAPAPVAAAPPPVVSQGS